MSIPITRGIKTKRGLYAIHGVAGAGKTHLASLFPNPGFIDMEDGTDRMDVARLPKPKSVASYLALLSDLAKDRSHGLSTLVIDTADWLQDLFIEQALAITGLKAMGWTKEENAYNVLYHSWGKMLDALTEVRDSGMHVVVLAHTAVKERKVPEEYGAFDQYQIKLLKGAADKLVEWSEYCWFLNMEIVPVKEKDGDRRGKATGGARVIHTTMHPCWIAKSKQSSVEIPDVITFERDKLPATITALLATQSGTTAKVTTKQEAPTAPPTGGNGNGGMVLTKGSTPHLRALLEVMQNSGVSVTEFQNEIAARGWFPEKMQLENLSEEFVNKTVACWDKVLDSIKKGR